MMIKVLITMIIMITVTDSFGCPGRFLDGTNNNIRPFFNDLISKGTSVQARGGVRYLEEKDFLDVLSEIEQIYNQHLIPAGVTLSIESSWRDDFMNAFAAPFDPTLWQIFVYGGYARSKYVTKDVIARVVCHEVGHYFGGTKLYPDSQHPDFEPWASGEGQADYYANLKCLRMYFQEKNNEDYLKDKEIPSHVVNSCNSVWGERTRESFICQRSSLAAYDLETISSNSRGNISFSTPDQSIANKTKLDYPSPQCRLDTSFQGALCDVDHNLPTDRDNTAGGYSQGTCVRSAGYTVGVRPLCWFNPSDFN